MNVHGCCDLWLSSWQPKYPPGKQTEQELLRECCPSASGMIGWIFETKRHVEKLPQAEWGHNRCLGNILSCLWDMMVATMDGIDFGENCCTCQVCVEILDVC